MDLLEELELIIAGIDWEEVVENTPHPPSPPLEFNTNSEPTQSGDPGRQAGAHSQGQCDNVPVLKPSVPTASPSNADEADPCSHDVSHIKNEYERPYIKKPPNAFMLFRKEQAPSVNAELDITGAAANTVLGKRWKNLSKEEQAKYYEQAKQEKQLHTQHFPEWSCKNNYGKKMKRDRRKVCTMAEASVSGPEEVTEQVMNVRLRPLRAAVRRLSAALKPHTHTAENPLTHTGLVEAPHEDIPATVHVLGSDDPPQTSEHLPLCAASCEQPPHPASMEDEETLLTEKLAHKVPTLHTFNISPLYFYYMD